MTPSRRSVLLSMVSALIGAGISPLRAQSVIAPDSLVRQAATITAFVDTLLPDDGVSPAASVLGIDKELRDFIAESDLFVRMTDMVCDWLNTLGPVPFAALSPQERVSIVDYMAEADHNMLEGRFYHLVRLLSIELYYARAEAVVGLDLAPAPQPAGYLPPWT
jgi:hypothetical protein